MPAQASREGTSSGQPRHHFDQVVAGELEAGHATPQLEATGTGEAVYIGVPVPGTKPGSTFLATQNGGEIAVPTRGS
jgi:hypothetical protein